MKSPRGFWASVVFLSAIPAALIVQMICGEGAETVLHFAFAAGAALLASAAFDFRTPVLLRMAGAAATGSLAVIFFLQGLGNILENAKLSYFAFDILGQRPERLLIDALVLFLAAILLYENNGRTRILGFITIGAAVAVEIYNYWLNYHGTTLDAEFAILKITLLIPFVWLMLESRRRTDI
jgi:hypothetical protein